MKTITTILIFASLLAGAVAVRVGHDLLIADAAMVADPVAFAQGQQ